MGLYERLAGAKAGEPEVEVETLVRQMPHAPDPLTEIRRRTHLALVKALGPALYDSSLSQGQLEEQVRSKLTEVIAQDATPLSQADRQRLIAETIDDILGYGPIEPLLHDHTVTEVMCNGPDQVYIERDGKDTSAESFRQHPGGALQVLPGKIA